MSFPIGPLDGQQTTQNGIVYNYSALTNSWRRNFNNAIDRLALTGQYQSTGIDTGTLIVDGGAGIAKNVNIGGSVIITDSLTVLDGQVNLSPAGANVFIQPSIGGSVTIFPSAYGSINNMVIGGTTPRIGYFTDLVVTDWAPSNSTNTGALTVTGGTGIGGNLYVGGSIYQNGIAVNLSNYWKTISSNYTAKSRDLLMVDTTTATVIVTLPLAPVLGDVVEFIDKEGTFENYNLIFARNGSFIMGFAEDLIVDVKNAANTLVYCDLSNGWKIGAVL